MKNNTKHKPESDKTATNRRPKLSLAQEPVRSTLTHFGSYTVLSNDFAAAHPDIAARVAEENAAFEAVMKEVREN